MPVFRSVRARHRVEIEKIRGSRFIGTCCPVAGEREADEFLESIRREMPDATHHCWAFRIDDELSRSSDDGEPRNSAGRPILQQIEGFDLDRVCVVITRFYGGTKLGTGGLVRAYGAAARAVLDDADIVETRLTTCFELLFPYELSGAVESVLRSHDLTSRDGEYGETVRLVTDVPIELAETFRVDFEERTAGRATIRVDAVHEG